MEILRKFILMILLLFSGVALICGAFIRDELLCNSQGNCNQVTYVKYLNFVLQSKTQQVPGLGSGKYTAICNKKTTADKAVYTLYWLENGKDYDVKSNYIYRLRNGIYSYENDLIACQVDSLKLNSALANSEFKMTFTRNILLLIIPLILGVFVILIALLVPFFKTATDEDIAAMQQSPAPFGNSQNDLETQKAIDDFVQKHGTTLKNIEHGIESNRTNIQTLLKILRSFGVKF